ncbi:MAG: NUDIX domain-containing protein [Myxococcota bacterium]
MRAYLIPIATVEAKGQRYAVALLQRKDHLLGPHLCDKMLAVGGKVEPGETPRVAALRELAEEVPGWWHATMGAATPEAEQLEPLLHDEEIAVFVVEAKADAVATRRFIHSTQEGVPAVLTLAAIRALPDACWVYPQMKAPLLERLAALETSLAG